MEFVKDAVPWGSAIGLRINTLGSASVAATEEWFKIGRHQLAPRGGFYDLRFTAELWEVYYYDYLALMTVDHPTGTEIFVDERFAIPPVKPAVTAVETPHPIARAFDDQGQDVTDIVSAVDDRVVDSFGLGQYQGVTRDSLSRDRTWRRCAGDRPALPHRARLDLSDRLIDKRSDQQE